MHLIEGLEQVFTASPPPGEYQGRGNPGKQKWGEETAAQVRMIKVYTASLNPGEYQGGGNPGAILLREETASLILLMLLMILTMYTASPPP